MYLFWIDQFVLVRFEYGWSSKSENISCSIVAHVFIVGSIILFQVVMVWGWVIVAAFTMTVALSMAGKY